MDDVVFTVLQSLINFLRAEGNTFGGARLQRNLLRLRRLSSESLSKANLVQQSNKG
jgi:hypothetical protein